ncbi:hypothetical protein [Streptomyces sp. NBC_00272]|uniref:hypothetical protein n=1 Tax=Streptomyces sp. NBC_00272 TaxID=2975698 RepID=UPI002E2DC8A3|nr:hypothetical protein [Streptomyces sp. NBC_00272]
MGQKATQEVEPAFETETNKLDLSVAQIAGSSLATVAAALLASKLGVYGTILGAGVVSVVATAGGPVIQHFFKRTGDQLRESARPGARRVPLSAEEEAPDGTPLLRAVPPSGEFGEATVHGTRVRGWKRTAVASVAAFAIALGGLGAYEAFSGTAISRGGATIWSGGTRKAGDERPADPGDQPGVDGRRGGRTPGSGSSPSPSGEHGGRGPSPDASAAASPDPGTGDSANSSDSGASASSPSPRPPTSSPKPTPTSTPTPTPTPTPSGGGRQGAP